MSIIDFSAAVKTFAGSDSSHVSSSNYSAHYRGLIHIDGYAAGEDSVRAFLSRLETTTVAESAHQLRGAFGLFIHDRSADAVTALVDNSGLYKVFRHGSRLSTSFLGLVDAAERAEITVVDAALIEFMAHGYVLGTGTFIDEVKKLGANEIVHLTHGSGDGVDVRIEPKVTPSVAAPFTTTFARLSDESERALVGASLSADLTGGLDTRVIVSGLSRSNLDFELATSGTPGSADLEIASMVARRLGKELLVTEHRVADLDEELADVFVSGDGQTDPIRFHRLRQLDEERLLRGIDTIAYGGGGELYKDFHLLQDFPTRGRRAPNYSRYYALRVAPIRIDDHLSDVGRRLLQDVRARTIRRFEDLGETTNVRGYLRVHYALRSPEFYGRTISNHVNRGLKVHAPFLDRDVFESGLAMPLSARLMNRWHRERISTTAPELAEVITTEGYSARSGRRFIGDLPAYALVQARRVARKVAQRVVGRSMFLQLGSTTNDTPALLDHLRSSTLARDAFEALHRRGLVSEGLLVDDVGETHVGRFLLAGMFLRFIENEADAHHTSSSTSDP